MYDLLNGMRLTEASAFVAAPLCGLSLLQLGAEVIRIDPIRGGPDWHRWPRGRTGSSLYWEGLNKGKKSIAIDLSCAEGKELAEALICAPGEDGGLFVTNYPLDSFTAYERLSARRRDLISLRIMGWADGTNAVDYTVNAAIGVPLVTGPADAAGPVNHVVPAWDLLAGSQAAVALLAAERHRRMTGKGAEIRLPLGDVAIAAMGHLGMIAEVETGGVDRARDGNQLFGAFGLDFPTSDGKRVMLVAITPKQWTALLRALDLGAPVAALEQKLGVSFADEGARYLHRVRLNELVTSRTQTRALQDLARVLDKNKVCWSVYRTLSEALSTDPFFSCANPLFTEVCHPSGERYRTPGASATLVGIDRAPAGRAPRLGEHGEQILTNILGLNGGEIRDLERRGVVAPSTPLNKEL